ncbi:MAG TPA: hypothetical protein VFE42_14105 [Chloroflexota bacterium]|nr:hypothetical protein [Chloroflexota bacterium]
MSSDSGRGMALGPVGGDQLRALLVAIAALAIVVLLTRRRRGEAGAGRASHRGERDGFSPQKMMLGLAITVLENDMARRGLLAGLKLIRNRM